MATAKMGCQGVEEARGGLGVAGEALWRPRGGERRPAMEVTRCDDAGEGGAENKARMGTGEVWGTHSCSRRRRRVAGVVRRREPAAARGGPTVAATWSERESE